MEQIPFIDLKAQYQAYKEEIDQAMAGVVRSAGFIQGPNVKALEQELADYTGAEHVITSSSGSDALLVALKALGIGPCDEVITTPFSFFATAEMISLLGGEPVFVDIDPVTYNIRADLIESHITERTKAIVPVSLYGQPADMEEIGEIASRHNLPVIEDAAQSFGAEYRGKKSGNLSTIGCTSFYPAKPFGCFGDGGAVFTNDKRLAESMRCIMNHGQSSGYNHVCIGINGRLDAVQAAVLRVKLKHFDKELTGRRAAVERYCTLFDGIEHITLPIVLEDRLSVFAQYTIRVKEREKFRQFLMKRGIPTAVHYPVPLYRQEAYTYKGHEWCESQAAVCMETEKAAGEVVSLPFGPFITEKQQQKVANAVADYTERRMR
jgi:UDP-2-acetamido-2-deoxy-ribo-hexuluronate aminotransferase